MPFNSDDVRSKEKKKKGLGKPRDAIITRRVKGLQREKGKRVCSLVEILEKGKSLGGRTEHFNWRNRKLSTEGGGVLEEYHENVEDNLIPKSKGGKNGKGAKETDLKGPGPSESLVEKAKLEMGE